MLGKLGSSFMDLKLGNDSAKRTKSGSATVGGDVVTKQETEIFIRPDGKKVKRIKKTIVRAKSSDGNSGDIAQMRGSLTNALDAQHNNNQARPKSNASATVHGSTPASRGVKVAQSFSEGEVYIRADGKKVRRVKKPVANSAGDLATPKADKKVASLPESASLAAVLNSPITDKATKKSGAATIGGGRIPEGEIIIRPDGKKVRRIKKVVSADPSEQPNLVKTSPPVKLGNPTKSGAATVSGPSRPVEGEIFINKEGKKVRRVLKKSVSSSAAAPSKNSSADSLTAVFGGSRIDVPSSKSGSASVGAVPVRKVPARATSYSEGEVYIRADGKKVRRVKKNPALGAQSMSVAEKDQALASMLDKPSARSAKMGSASVAGGGLVVVKEQVGEIYINADGKKVRKVRKIVTKPKDGASLGGHIVGNAKGGIVGAATVAGRPQEGEIYIRADGKKCRRVKKKSEPKTTTKTIAIAKPKVKDDASVTSTTSLNKFKKKKSSDGASVSSTTSLIKFKKKKSSDDASVSSTTSKNKFKKKKSADDASITSTTSKNKFKKKNKSTDDSSVTSKSKATKRNGEEDEDGFIKLTISKPDSMAVETSGVTESTSTFDRTNFLDGFLSKLKKSKKKASGSATVTGASEKKKKKGKTVDALACSDDESVVAPTIEELKTGKKTKDDSSQGNKPKENGSTLDGFFDNNRVSRKNKSGAASVSGDQVSNKKSPLIDLRAEFRKLREQRAKAEAESKRNEVLQLSEHDHEIASKYLKMKNMGFPDDAVKHKMVQDGVTENIVQFVVIAPAEAEIDSAGSDKDKEIQELPSISDRAIPLGNEDDATDSLHEEALRNKIQQDGVSPNIIADVMGGESKGANTSTFDTTESYSVNLSTGETEVAKAYRKMKQMGLSDDAVRHKMTQDEIDPKIIAAALGNEWNEESENSDSGNAVPSLSVLLSAEEEEIAKSYNNMIKMGLTRDVVQHKMKQDGISEKIAATVIGDECMEPVASMLSVDVDALGVQMSEMGLLEDTLQRTTLEDGVDANAAIMGKRLSAAPAQISADAAVATLSEDEEIVAETYRMMKKMGLPEGAVRHKMNQDGVHGNIIAAVFQEPLAETGSSAFVAQPALSKTVMLTADEETSAEKYRKMTNMGLSGEAVRHKLNQDGITDKLVAIIFNEQSHEKPIENSKRYALSVDGPKEESWGNETFEVALDHGERSKSGKKKYETKFMSIDDIARLSGQSRDSLEQLIKDKRKNSEKIPKFVLQPLADDDPSEGAMFEVEIPHAKHGGRNLASANPKLNNVDPRKLREVHENQEVVGSELANAARAMSAMGETDVSALLAQLQQGDMGALLKKMQKLEKQLAQAGIAIAEDIDYEEANKKVVEIAKRMSEIGGSDVTNPDKEIQNRLREEYFKLEQEMERYSTALKLTEEYQAEQERMERLWDETNNGPNEEAIRKIRRHMPVKIRNMSEAELTNTPSPNGKFLPQAMAKKFKRTNILQLLRVNPDDIERMHPASLEGMRVTGLTLTERRAIYSHLKALGPKWDKNKAEAMTKRKFEWFKMLKLNFKETVAPYQRHVEQYGPPENHVGCPLIGKQCPIKADKMVDYDGDYGWTPEPEFEVSQVTKVDSDDPGAKAMQEARELAREKKANERADLLKKHYKGKLLQVSKASGSCESMDETMDKMEFAIGRWIQFIIEKGKNESETDKSKEVANFTDTLNDIKLGVLDYCKRSGMQTSGKKKEGGDDPDIRSSVECGLAVEVYEHGREFFKFIKDRMKELEARDARVEKTIELLENMLSELNDKNQSTLASLGVACPDKSRKLKKAADIRKAIEDKMQSSEEEVSPEEAAPGPTGPRGGGGRGGLLGDIAGRGRGGRGGLLGDIAGRGRGGRGGLLGDIAGRGGGGRGGLLGDIAGRGRGGRGGLLDSIKGGRGGTGGGRGDLLSSISGRGRGGGGAETGGRGGLLASIQGRGAGDAGSRGGLLAAIQARGGGS